LKHHIVLSAFNEDDYLVFIVMLVCVFHLCICESRVCECGNGIEDSHYFFFECPRYVHPRHILESELQLSWEESCNDRNIVISLQSVLAPYNDSRIVYAARKRILAATFNYIRRSGRQL